MRDLFGRAFEQIFFGDDARISSDDKLGTHTVVVIEREPLETEGGPQLWKSQKKTTVHCKDAADMVRTLRGMADELESRETERTDT